MSGKPVESSDLPYGVTPRLMRLRLTTARPSTRTTPWRLASPRSTCAPTPMDRPTSSTAAPPSSRRPRQSLARPSQSRRRTSCSLHAAGGRMGLCMVRRGQHQRVLHPEQGAGAALRHHGRKFLISSTSARRRARQTAAYAGSGGYAGFATDLRRTRSTWTGC